MPRSRKSQRAKQRAKREQEINWGVLPLRRADGKTKDPAPHVASWNMVTWDGYSELGGGFPIIETKDDRDTYMDKVREYREEGNITGDV